MSLVLDSSPDVFKSQFLTLQRPEDIAKMLDVRYQDFNYWVYRTPQARRYSSFYIPKKNGAPRKIDAPNTNIKILQQKLNQVLYSVYRPKPSVQGFAPGRNIRSNAERHVGRRWVLNLDLENFFPSINFGRVRGMFMGKPYFLPEEVATVLANLSCYQGALPQGGPTSPVISNMICAQMDSQLIQLARASRSTYTRYADDMTFSTTIRRFPSSLAVLNELNQVTLGGSLKQIIARNGFEINANKVRLLGRHSRQEVTGVTVNDFPNLTRKYTNQIRAMLHAWRKYGLDAAQDDWEKNYSKKHRAPWSDTPCYEQVLKGKIEYLGMVKGQESLTYLKFLDQLWALDSSLANGRGTPLHLLFREYDSLTESTDSQRRGYLFEKLMNGLLELFGIEVEESFRRNSGGEQVDGAFKYDGWHYLAECKWQKSPSDIGDLDGLNGKLGRSGAQSMGVFISINGWSGHVITLMKQNESKRIFLIDGEDIRMVLTGEVSLIALIKAKQRAFNFRSEPFISAHDI